MFTDTANWVLIERCFTADQAYNWIAIGNFYNDEITDTLQLEEPGKCYAIYFIENICVATDPAHCDYLKQEEDVSSVNGQGNSPGQIEIYPNPTTDVLKVKSSIILTDIQVFNGIGQKISSFTVNTQEFSIETTYWSKGLYVLEVEDEGGNHQIFKLINNEKYNFICDYFTASNNINGSGSP